MALNAATTFAAPFVQTLGTGWEDIRALSRLQGYKLDCYDFVSWCRFSHCIRAHQRCPFPAAVSNATEVIVHLERYMRVRSLGKGQGGVTLLCGSCPEKISRIRSPGTLRSCAPVASLFFATPKHLYLPIPDRPFEAQIHGSPGCAQLAYVRLSTGCCAREHEARTYILA